MEKSCLFFFIFLLNGKIPPFFLYFSEIKCKHLRRLLSKIQHSWCHSQGLLQVHFLPVLSIKKCLSHRIRMQQRNQWYLSYSNMYSLAHPLLPDIPSSFYSSSLIQQLPLQHVTYLSAHLPRPRTSSSPFLIRNPALIQLAFPIFLASRFLYPGLKNEACTEAYPFF